MKYFSKRYIKQICCILTFVLVLCGLLACANPNANGSPDAELHGVYRAVSATYEEELYDAESVFEKAVSLTFRNGGKGTIDIGSETEPFRWNLDGETLTVKSGADVFTGTLREGVFSVSDFLGTGIAVVFASETKQTEAVLSARQAVEDAEAARIAEANPTPEPLRYDPDWWTGKWYGWLVYTAGTGPYASDTDLAYDQIAEITADGDTGRIVLWSIDGSSEQPTADVQFVFGAGESRAGSVTSVGGSFENFAIGFGSWRIDPAVSSVTMFSRMIEIKGTSYDTEGQSVSYSIYLRPWGMDWEDVRASIPNAETPYENMMPIEYDSRYIYEAGLVEPSGQPETKE